MKFLVTISALFMLGGSAGYLCELIYRRIVHGKWINPGFLSGPCLPLYGSGVLLLYGCSSLDLSFLSSPAAQDAVRIVFLAILLTALEYVTGIVFTTVYHVKLWDYSKRPGNIQGVICPLFSLIWAAAGAGYVLLLHPHLVRFVRWLVDNPFYSYFCGMYVGVFLVDVCYSFNVVKKLKAFAEERQLQIRYENLKLSIAKNARKRSFLFAFRTPSDLREELERYRETLRENIESKRRSRK